MNFRNFTFIFAFYYFGVLNIAPVLQCLKVYINNTSPIITTDTDIEFFSDIMEGLYAALNSSSATEELDFYLEGSFTNPLPHYINDNQTISNLLSSFQGLSPIHYLFLLFLKF